MNDVSGTQRLARVSNSKRLNELSARTIVNAIRDRRLTAVSVMEACLERIAVREPQVKAWSFLDVDLARQRARQADEWQAAGFPIGPLHGLPVEFSGVLGDVRGYVAEPVGFVSRADQVPQRCGAGLEDGEEPV